MARTGSRLGSGLSFPRVWMWISILMVVRCCASDVSEVPRTDSFILNPKLFSGEGPSNRDASLFTAVVNRNFGLSFLSLAAGLCTPEATPISPCSAPSFFATTSSSTDWSVPEAITVCSDSTPSECSPPPLPPSSMCGLKGQHTLDASWSLVSCPNPTLSHRLATMGVSVDKDKSPCSGATIAVVVHP